MHKGEYNSGHVVPIVTLKGLELQVIILIREALNALNALKVATNPPLNLLQALKCAPNCALNLWNSLKYRPVIDTNLPRYL